MQKIKCALLSVAILFVGGSNAQVRRLDAARIDEKSHAIKKMIERHNSIVGGLTALATMQQLLFFMPMFIAGFNKVFDRPTCLCGSESSVVPVHVPFFSAMATGFKDTFCTADGWQNLLKFCAGEAATHFILQKIDTEFRHPDTLRWYVYAHVPYVRVIKTIKNLTIKLQEDDLDVQERKHYYFMLYGCCDRLSGYGEDMCAYMVYKSSDLEGRTALMAERMARYIMNYQNEFLGSIDAELERDVPDYHVIRNLITGYEAEMRSHRDMFAVIEGELQRE